MTDQTADPVAVVIGSTRGIGLAVGCRLARSGHRVVLNSATGIAAEDAVAQVATQSEPDWVCYERADTRSLDELDALAHRVAERWGRIDVLVNCGAPTVHIDFFERLDPSRWLDVLDAKLVSQFRAIRAVLPMMRAAGGGSVVNVITDAGRVGTAGETLVSAAAGGSIAAAKSLARELARYRITVNNVAISLVRDSGGYERVMASPTAARIFHRIADRMPLGLLDPGDVADAVGYLAVARRVTGQTLSVNSGLSFPS